MKTAAPMCCGFPGQIARPRATGKPPTVVSLIHDRCAQIVGSYKERDVSGVSRVDFALFSRVMNR